MASCNLRNFGPCLSQFREIQLFSRNPKDFVNYNKPWNATMLVPTRNTRVGAGERTAQSASKCVQFSQLLNQGFRYAKSQQGLEDFNSE